MIEVCDLVAANITDAAQLEDPLVQAAAERWIEILGEAAANVSEKIRLAHPEVSWREIVGTRVILAHAYFHIDPDVIRTVITDDLSRLQAQLVAIEQELGSR